MDKAVASCHGFEFSEVSQVVNKLGFRGLVVVGAVAIALSAAGVASAAYEFLVAARGTKQGNFTADSSTGIVGLAYYHEVLNPSTSAATGAASGKLQYGPVTITKAWGPSSPQFYAALFTNEVLASVTFTFNFQATGGTTAAVKLVNATVSSIRRRSDPVSGPVEDISFTYQSIEVDDTSAGMSAIGTP